MAIMLGLRASIVAPAFIKSLQGADGGRPRRADQVAYQDGGARARARFRDDTAVVQSERNPL
jgi:hypothetical protein